MLSQYLQYLDHLDNTSLLAGQTHVLGISVFFLSLVGRKSNTGTRENSTSLHVPYMYLTLRWVIYDQQQLFRHENGVNATSS